MFALGVILLYLVMGFFQSPLRAGEVSTEGREFSPMINVVLFLCFPVFGGEGVVRADDLAFEVSGEGGVVFG